MEPAQPAADPAPDPLGALRHRWWLVVLVTGLGVVAAAGWLQTRPVVWESTTSVLVHPAGQDTNVVGGRTRGDVNLDTEAQLVRSTAVATGARERLARDRPPESQAPDSRPPDSRPPDGRPAPDRTPDELAAQVRVEVPPNTSVLMITFAGGSPAEAQAGARAFARAYLEHRTQAARAGLAAQTAAIEDKLDELDGTLTELTGQLAVTPPDTTTAVDLASRRATVVDQISTLTDRLNTLTTATVSAGTVINEARLPTDPSRPRPAIVLASGAALGLVTGAGAAALMDRLARRVRRPADLSGRLGVPVLASFRPAAPRLDEVASPFGPAGRTYDRLRNEVTSAGGTGSGDTGQVVVVTSPTGAATAGPVAVNLAASLSRTGHDTTLVEAAGGTTGPLTRLLGVAAAPGLSELLAGRAAVAEALQQPPRFPRLRAVTMGGTATATGLLQSPALRTVLATLAARTGYVVVAAPATADSADAQSLAGRADVALLAVEARRTRIADVADAVAQLRRVGTPLVGAVLVPARRRRLRPGRQPRPAADRAPADDAPADHDPPADHHRPTDHDPPADHHRPTDHHPPADDQGPATVVMPRLVDQPGPPDLGAAAPGADSAGPEPAQVADPAAAPVRTSGRAS